MSTTHPGRTERWTDVSRAPRVKVVSVDLAHDPANAGFAGMVHLKIGRYEFDNIVIRIVYGSPCTQFPMKLDSRGRIVRSYPLDDNLLWLAGAAAIKAFLDELTDQGLDLDDFDVRA